MNITCTQMDILLSFYMDGELTNTLKAKVEKHLSQCPTCRAKYNILSSLFGDIEEEEDDYATHAHSGYSSFKNNLSAYVDNELPPEENIKIKKYTISNKKARKDLEDTYHIRKLMRDSFDKTKQASAPDFAKGVLKKMNLEDKNSLAFNPLIKVSFAFVMTVLILSIIILFSLSM